MTDLYFFTNVRGNVHTNIKSSSKQQFFVLFEQFKLKYLIEMIIVTLILGVILIGTGSLVKHYVYRTARRFTKRLQRGIFEKMLNTKLADANDPQTVGSLNAFLDSNFRGNHNNLYE